MNIEITDLDNILNYLETTSLEPHDDYSSEFTYKEQKILYKYIKQLKQENKQLKDNWNKLKEDLINDINYWQEQEKEWIKLGFITFGGKANNKIIFKKVLDKMQELEQGSDNNGQCKNN